MTTAVGAYATLAEVEARLDATGNTTWPASQVTVLQKLCDQVNAWIESYTGRIIAPDSTASYTQDGFDALANGRLFMFPRGIRALTKLEVATNTGATLQTVPATDYFLRPSGPDLEPGWPYTEVWMTDIPSATNQTPAFFPGYDNVRFTGSFGWSAIPDDIADLAVTLVVGKWRARSSGGGNTFTIGADGERTWERLMSDEDRKTINRYRIKGVSIL